MGVGPDKPYALPGRSGRAFWLVLKAGVLLGLFLLSGLGSAHLVLARAAAQGKPEYAVRLAAYMTGLFVAGFITTIAGVAMLLLGRKRG